MDQKHIELIARAVIINEVAILLCRSRGKDNFFFPGGHVDFGEDSADALRRELKEETGAVVTDTRFMGVVENQFAQDGEKKQEVNIVFEASLASPDIQNLEDHIECVWVPLKEFEQGRVLPVLLKEKVMQWMKDGQVFFGSEKNN